MYPIESLKYENIIKDGREIVNVKEIFGKPLSSIFIIDTAKKILVECLVAGVIIEDSEQYTFIDIIERFVRDYEHLYLVLVFDNVASVVPDYVVWNKSTIVEIDLSNMQPVYDAQSRLSSVDYKDNAEQRLLELRLEMSKFGIFSNRDLWIGLNRQKPVIQKLEHEVKQLKSKLLDAELVLRKRPFQSTKF